MRRFFVVLALTSLVGCASSGKSQTSGQYFGMPGSTTPAVSREESEARETAKADAKAKARLEEATNPRWDGKKYSELKAKAPALAADQGRVIFLALLNV